MEGLLFCVGLAAIIWSFSTALKAIGEWCFINSQNEAFRKDNNLF